MVLMVFHWRHQNGGKVLEHDLGHECFWFGGKLDTPKDKSFPCDEAFFGHESVVSLQEKLFNPSIDSYRPD